jgi:hypothetical protein
MAQQSERKIHRAVSIGHDVYTRTQVEELDGVLTPEQVEYLVERGAISGPFKGKAKAAKTEEAKAQQESHADAVQAVGKRQERTMPDEGNMVALGTAFVQQEANRDPAQDGLGVTQVILQEGSTTNRTAQTKGDLHEQVEKTEQGKAALKAAEGKEGNKAKTTSTQPKAK